MLFTCDGLCMYTSFMLPVTAPNVLGIKISEEVFILKKTKPKLQRSCDNLVLSLFSRKKAEGEEGTIWPTAVTGGCASAVQKVGFLTPFLLFVLLLWLLWRLE